MESPTPDDKNSKEQSGTPVQDAVASNAKRQNLFSRCLQMLLGDDAVGNKDKAS